MADLNAVFGHVCETFGIRGLNAYQREAIVQFGLGLGLTLTLTSAILSRVTFFNNKHEFTQSWKTASDWSAVDERKWLFESADVRGGENA